MTEDMSITRDRILLATLPHAAFDGWTRRALKAGVADAGLTLDMALRAFPGGINQLVDHLADWADRRMLEELNAVDLESMRVRDCVQTCVRVRLQVLDDYRESIRRLLSYLAMPQNTPLAVRLTWRTVDAIWYTAGDKASDFNYYTKRGLLTPVYATTVLYWLGDDSEGSADTWAYLERRITDVMKIPAYQSRLKKALSSLPQPSRLFRPLKGTPSRR